MNLSSLNKEYLINVYQNFLLNNEETLTTLNDKLILAYFNVSQNVLFYSVLSFFLMLSYSVYKLILYPRFFSPLNKIPGPPSAMWTLIGNLQTIMNEDNLAPHRRWAAKYGNFVKYTSLFNKGRVLVLDPKAIQRILVTAPEIYERQSEGDFFNYVIGPGLLSVHGGDHKRQRALINPAFSYKNIKNMSVDFSELSLDLKRKWSDLIKTNQTIDILPEVSKFTLDVIGRTGFGFEFNALKDEHSDLHEFYETVLLQTELSPFLILESFFPFLSYLPTKRNREFKKCVNGLHKVVDNLIIEKRKNLEQKKLENNLEEEKDILSMLIKANESEVASKKLSDAELKGQVGTFLLAGHETTSVALSWTLYYLALNPDIQEKLYVEVSKVLDTKDSFPTFDQVNTQMKYVDSVIKEVLRLVPPAPITSRVTTQDDELGGYMIPKGTPIILAPGVIQRHKEFWGENADEFVPERWLETNETSKNIAKFIPFLFGPRNCIGSKFALIEMNIVLSVLVKNFRFEQDFDFPLKDVKKKIRITWKPEPGIKLKVFERQ
ncbi:hypothetical protein HDU92_005580 [Lobulomyces angularis]|nr:hypothetical protein HDU92_005580 [Lobulomyces angularis]